MTEHEWLTCDNPRKMLHHLIYTAVGVGGRRHGTAEGGPVLISDRKLRMFSYACAGLLGATNPGLYGKDGEKIANPQECAAGWSRAEVPVPPKARAALLRDIIGNPFRSMSVPWCVVRSAVDMSVEALESGASEEYCPAVPWITRTVLSLALTAYTKRQDNGTLDPARLSVLADALEDAGCTNDDILRHLRGFEWCPSCWGTEEVSDDSGGNPGRVRWCYECREGWVAITGNHVCGCWALDLVLGKK